MNEPASWQLLIDAIAHESDARRRANLEVVARHVVAEVEGDLDELMSTLVAEPAYTIWGTSTSIGPRGRAEVARHYQRLIASGKNRLEYHISRVVVDDRTVITEGQFRFAYRGADIAPGVTHTGEPVVAAAWYLTAYRCLVVWPISETGLIEGEEIYTGEVARPLRRLDDGECPHLGPIERMAL